MQTWVWRKLPDTETTLDEFIRLVNVRFAKLTDTIANLLNAVQTVNAFSNGAATPSVAGSSLWTIAYTVPTNITALTEGQAGQRVTLFATTANATIVNSAALRTKTGANVTLGATSTIEFATTDGTNFREV